VIGLTVCLSEIKCLQGNLTQYCLGSAPATVFYPSDRAAWENEDSLERNYYSCLGIPGFYLFQALSEPPWQAEVVITLVSDLQAC